jgi:hypothetical protein
MPELPHAVKAQIDAAFKEAFPRGHSQCVSDCKDAYQICVTGLGKNCRSELESCISGCPDGERLSPESKLRLLETLAAIKS